MEILVLSVKDAKMEWKISRMEWKTIFRTRFRTVYLMYRKIYVNSDNIKVFLGKCLAAYLLLTNRNLILCIEQTV